MKKLFLLIFVLFFLFTNNIFANSVEPDNNKDFQLNISDYMNSYPTYLGMPINKEILYNQEFYFTLANQVTDADIALYGDEIDEIIILYDKEKNIDLLGIQNAISNNSSLLSTNYSSIYSDCFTNVSWINRDGVWSLSVYHTFNGLQFNGGHSGQTAFNALAYFKVGIDRWPSSATSSMRNQFLCHVDIARQFKNPYNLEPSREDKGTGFWLSGCN